MSNREQHFSYDELKNFLTSLKSGEVTLFNREVIKAHIDVCLDCWTIWNVVRWDLAVGTKGYEELKEFLGDSFVEYFDSSWALANQWREKERKSKDQIANFYENTPYYIYNSLIHHESGDRENTSFEIKKIIKKYKVKSVIDFGCGVGTDGLAFLNEEVFVHFIDFENLSVDFLKWRLKKRGLKNYKVHDVLKVDIFPAADMLWAYDVFEHMPNPLDVLDKLNPNIKVIVYESGHDDVAGGRHPFHFHFDQRAFSKKLKKLGFKKQESNSLEVFQRG